jgi:hypothetical protein
MKPPKQKRLGANPGDFETDERNFLPGSRSQSIWFGWQREAARLFTEFSRSGRREHLTAFSRHIAAMRQQLR